MKILEKVRHISFWSVDFINGAKVSKYIKNIKYILNNYSSDASKQLRNKNLRNLLKHAAITTSFYNKYSPEKFEEFPVINKNIFRSNFEDFKSKKFLNKKKKLVSTSGSTGATLQVFHNKNKLKRNTADTIYFSRLAGFKVGYKLLYLRLWDEYMMKSKTKFKIQNIKPINVLNLNDDYIEDCIEQIEKDSSNKSIISYASALEQICICLDKKKYPPIKANVKSIIAMSESLNEYTKTSIQKYFNQPALSRYSNLENGILAQQTLENTDDFKINWASYYIEILEFDKDIPVKSGKLGRIVVTDVFNYAMPMIRYDTGDVGSIDYSVIPPVLKKVEGRKMDVILNTKGEIISSLIMAGSHRFKGTIQSQLIQEDEKEYILKLNVNESFNSESKIINEFKNVLGEDAKITIEYIDEIPLLASGKRRFTINNYIS